jgi:hypothetical protein
MVLPKHMFEEYNGANGREAPANTMPVGTGPYRVVDFTPGDVVVYEANPNYRDADSLAFSRVELKGGRRCHFRCPGRAANRRCGLRLQPAGGSQRSAGPALPGGAGEVVSQLWLPD